MIFGSVCSGIEAASVAWHPLGWRAAFVSEIEPLPCAVLKHHYPDVANLGDMTKFKGWPDATLDVLVGGTPCQSFSVAGLRKGLDDPRGNLMLTYLAIADRYRPRWLVWENVPGVLSDRGNAFGAFLGGLGQLGYGFAYRVLDAQFFGVPQRRRRVFVVGCLGDWRRAAAVLFERHSLSGHPAPRRETGESFTHPVAPCIGASGRGFERTGDTRGQDCLIARSVAIRGRDGVPQVELGDDKANAILTPNGGRGGIGVGAALVPNLHAEISPALKARDGKGPSSDGDGAILVPMVAHSLRAEGFDASEDGTGGGTPLVPVGVTIHGTDKTARVASFTDTAGALRARAPGGQENSSTTAVMAFAQNQRDEVRQMHVAGALASEPGMKQQTYMQQGMQVRRLTPRECERLQGFPDDYTQVPYRNKPAADGPRYKALGNSMAVPVMAWIGQRIALVDAIEQKAAA